MAVLSLGCSRWGSLVGGVDPARARALVERAAMLGVCHFDTADIYGQGDSERMLGKLLAGLPAAHVTTKAGQRFPLKKRAILAAKPILRPLLKRRAGLADAAARNRAGVLPQDWSEQHLRKAITGSLKRLRRERVDDFLLHSPDSAVLLRGDAMTVLCALKQEGKAARIGASVDDREAFSAAIADPRIEVVQLPCLVMQAAPELVEEARARDLVLAVREIFSGHAGDAGAAIAAIPPGADMVLTGTGSPDHLAETHKLLDGASC
ncbi:aldo/keto reductase [Croceicoccus mobilis]|uniref:NADP-dependent oxidoreductase domain-containing protein n=1 Tax=Croceicoccus mobilis TaxID=1703339 RepID=A0A916YX16_9SPHN|nr:aldo/keto reductase [Croceicoccus mobilis]GGD65943.1 hypothetical protein GCM10010990_14280 [Croceicoccus mobilis]